ncbi:MAG TPA: 3-methyl-2-oxobutanoate hydroxymethyltransferase [Limnochordia bacterium]|nr:3-methyl-2-oxobutanoate hydroxymethyltransferase [Limnochordia bacterium]
MKPVRVTDLARLRREGQKIAVVTAYDYTSALLVDASSVDVLLVGDSLGNTMLGYETTIPVSLEEMCHHVRAVRRGVRRALLVADLPFGSYQTSVDEAVRSAVTLLKAGADAVKLEGGRPIVPAVQRMVQVGIPVMGHLGFTPQSVHAMGGYRVQGRGESARERLLDEATALAAAGAFAIVLELVPAPVAAAITEQLAVPTIGIGAGRACSGQVLVWQDLLGLTSGEPKRFVKPYADLAGQIGRALGAYADEVRSGQFPDDAHSFPE